MEPTERQESLCAATAAGFRFENDGGVHQWSDDNRKGRYIALTIIIIIHPHSAEYWRRSRVVADSYESARKTYRVWCHARGGGFSFVSPSLVAAAWPAGRYVFVDFS
jgi:hypothetical protein